MALNVLHVLREMIDHLGGAVSVEDVGLVQVLLLVAGLGAAVVVAGSAGSVARLLAAGLLLRAASAAA